MHPKQATEIFNVEFQKKLKEEIFPNDLLPLPEHLNNIKHIAMQTESLETVAMKWAEYKAFMMKQENYSLFEVAQLLNIISRKTPADMSGYDFTNMPDYYAIQEAAYNTGEKWKELKQPLEDSARKKVEIMVNGAGGQMNGKKLRGIITGN